MHKFKSLEEQAFILHNTILREHDLDMCNLQNLRDTCISNTQLNPIDSSLISSTRYNKFNLYTLNDGLGEDVDMVRSRWENKDDQSNLGGFTWGDDS